VVANQSLVEIHNLDSIWIEAHLPTQIRSHISIASQGQASVLSNDNIHFPVHVTRIGPIVSETTRTQRIWLMPSLDPNPTLKQGLEDQAALTQQIGVLRDGMQITVLIKSVDGPSALVVPLEAVLRDGLHAFVFVQKADDYVERRRVTVGRTDGEFIEITSGIVAGEAVVSAGGRELQTAFASLR
jgi:multidrug efflux pump subunit AcrA (membrane-fusion protein)